MNFTVRNILLFLALLCFFCATFNLNPPKVNLSALGLFLLTAAFLVGE